jgi:phage gpG-like protein
VGQINISRAEQLLRQHAYRREQAWYAAITAGLVRARARAATFWMPQASPTAAPRGDKLSRRSGKLAATIRVVPPRKRGNDLVWGLTAGSSSVPYARIHEFGGKTRPHRIEPKNGNALRWFAGRGNPVFARFVNHPGSKIPARPYMRPAVNEQVRSIAADFRRMGRAITRELFG